MKDALKIIFMGTPEFAEVVLEKLIVSETYRPALVMTQPDKPVGRKKEITPPPVKILAQKHGIAVWQPDKIKNGETIAKIKKENPDLIIIRENYTERNHEHSSFRSFKCARLAPAVLPRRFAHIGGNFKRRQRNRRDHYAD